MANSGAIAHYGVSDEKEVDEIFRPSSNGDKMRCVIQARPRKTVDDFMKLPEGTLAELIEGEIIVSPAPKARHQRIVANLHFALRSHAEKRRLGRVDFAPLDVHLPSGDIVEPDLIFVATANLHIIQDWIRGVPDLLVEVLSPTGVERDRIIKRRLYAQNGVREYWIIDPESRTVEVLALLSGRYEPCGYFQESETLSTPLFRDLALPVRDIFA